jgi:hypothetical protein
MGGANDKLGDPKQELFAKFGWMEVTIGPRGRRTAGNRKWRIEAGQIQGEEFRLNNEPPSGGFFMRGE